MDQPNELATWLKLNRISQEDFSKRMNSYQTSISRLCRGKMVPSLSLAAAIADETEGAVAMRYWLRFLPQYTEADDEDV